MAEGAEMVEETGRCCANGMFDEPHVCEKSLSAGYEPAAQETLVSWRAIAYAALEEARIEKRRREIVEAAWRAQSKEDREKLARLESDVDLLDQFLRRCIGASGVKLSGEYAGVCDEAAQVFQVLISNTGNASFLQSQLEKAGFRIKELGEQLEYDRTLVADCICKSKSGH